MAQTMIAITADMQQRASEVGERVLDTVTAAKLARDKLHGQVPDALCRTRERFERAITGMPEDRAGALADFTCALLAGTLLDPWNPRQEMDERIVRLAVFRLVLETSGAVAIGRLSPYSAACLAEAERAIERTRELLARQALLSPTQACIALLGASTGAIQPPRETALPRVFATGLS